MLTPKLKRRLLKPLHGRGRRRESRAELQRALAVIDDAIASMEALRPLARAFSETHDRGAIGSADAIAATRAWIEMADAMLRARRISWAQFVFTVGFLAERAHEDRLFR